MGSEASIPRSKPQGSDDKQMRIHDQNPAGAGAASGLGASRGAGESRPVAGSEGGRGGIGTLRGSGDPDRVSLSNLAASLAPSGVEREAELDRLAELFGKGIYEPDPAVVAEAMLDEALSEPEAPQTEGPEDGHGGV